MFGTQVYFGGYFAENIYRNIGYVKQKSILLSTARSVFYWVTIRGDIIFFLFWVTVRLWNVACVNASVDWNEVVFITSYKLPAGFEKASPLPRHSISSDRSRSWHRWAIKSWLRLPLLVRSFCAVHDRYHLTSHPLFVTYINRTPFYNLNRKITVFNALKYNDTTFLVCFNLVLVLDKLLFCNDKCLSPHLSALYATMSDEVVDDSLVLSGVW